MINNNAVASRIKQIRNNNGWTLEQLGERLNASKVSVHNWENARNLPNKKRLKQIADLGGTSVDYLLYGDIENFARSVFIEEMESFLDKLRNKDNSQYIVKYFSVKEAGNEFDHWLEENIEQLDYNDERVRQVCREIVRNVIERNKKNDKKDEAQVLHDTAYKIMGISNQLRLEYYEIVDVKGEEVLSIKDGFHESAFDTAQSIIDEAGMKILALKDIIKD
ncbi:Helix-turn-helix domain-containing protein [Alkalibacterium gilvum]|uniref:Helix-turn-helix domain-containing protein n=1 Tax=Alkalibacterium gilvum TaxID=1130080 RepID=A0A1H6RTM0_9LACT|nr:helix-turn-helix transcriptional regulator [Alkalibacterium gilvum]SEI59101.1 Helix-turn-helix domain-containing protein [Alkalibacterium gilvum]